MTNNRVGGFHTHHVHAIPQLMGGEGEDGYIYTWSEEAGAGIWLPPSVASLPAGGTTNQALAKDSATDGDATWHDVVDLFDVTEMKTTETDTNKRLRPNGTGGVEWI